MTYQELAQIQPLWGYPDIRDIGRRVHAPQLVTLFQNQTGLELCPYEILPPAGVVDWVRDRSQRTTYAVPYEAIWWLTVVDRTNEIPYDNENSDGYEFDCQSYARRFNAIFDRGCPELGWHMACVGMMSTGKHRMVIFLNSDDMKFWLVEQTTKDSLRILKPGTPFHRLFL